MSLSSSGLLSVLGREDDKNNGGSESNSSALLRIGVKTANTGTGWLEQLVVDIHACKRVDSHQITGHQG